VPSVDGPTKNLKSDVLAKQAYCADLLKRGFSNPKVIGSPSDVTAEKDGAIWYFEIKCTRKKDKYFGAATLTEWIQAAKDPRHFRFVVASENDGLWLFQEYDPETFIGHSYIPPFKIYFNVMMKPEQIIKSRRQSTSVPMTLERLRQMEELYRAFKKT
jgi:hypothetical protein